MSCQLHTILSNTVPLFPFVYISDNISTSFTTTLLSVSFPQCFFYYIEYDGSEFGIIFFLNALLYLQCFLVLYGAIHSLNTNSL